LHERRADTDAHLQREQCRKPPIGVLGVLKFAGDRSRDLVEQ
jgi:hypothetical protein